MRFSTVSLFSIVLLVQQAAAVTLTSTSAKSIPTLPACVATCVGASLVAGGCTNITDYGCICTSQTFKTASNACIKQQCSSTDAAAAKIVEDAECAAISAANSTSSTTANATSSSSTSTSTASSPALKMEVASLRAIMLTASVGILGAAAGGLGLVL